MEDQKSNNNEDLWMKEDPMTTEKEKE